jgi:hypothetical protein
MKHNDDATWDFILVVALVAIVLLALWSCYGM